MFLYYTIPYFNILYYIMYDAMPYWDPYVYVVLGGRNVLGPRRKGGVYGFLDIPRSITQRAQYPLIKEYTFKHI